MGYKASVNINFTENKSKGYINYGVSNDLPSVIIELVNNSNITQACLNTKKFFTKGAGFADEKLKDVKINRKQTLKKFLNETVNEYITFEGFAWKIYYNTDGAIAKMEVSPFECYRLGLPDEKKGVISNVKFKENWNPQRGQKTEMVSYDLFNPNTDYIKEQITLLKTPIDNYCQIYYYAESRPGARTYPVPQYMGGDWINIDGEISKFHYTNLLSGFFSSALVTLYGKTQGVTAEGTPVQMDAIEAIRGSVGSENAGNVAIVIAETKEQKPDIQNFNSNGNSEMFNTLQEQTIQNICIGHQTPTILVGIETAGKLGGSQEILNAIDLFQNNIVSPLQENLEECFREVFQYWNMPIESDFEIKNVKPFNSIPDKLMDVLTEDEKRALINYAPKVVDPNVQAIANYESYYLAEVDQFMASNVTPQMIAEKYNEYFRTVNMNANEFQRWADTEASKSTGTSRIPIVRSLELLNINKGDWNAKHYRWASQAIGFLNRIRDMPEAAMIEKYGMNRKAIVMKNWAMKT